MKNKLWIVLLLVACLSIAACTSATTAPTEVEEAAPEEAAPEEAAPMGPETIKIGTSAPISGMFAGFGDKRKSIG